MPQRDNFANLRNALGALLLHTNFEHPHFIPTNNHHQRYPNNQTLAITLSMSLEDISLHVPQLTLALLHRHQKLFPLPRNLFFKFMRMMKT